MPQKRVLIIHSSGAGITRRPQTICYDTSRAQGISNYNPMETVSMPLQMQIMQEIWKLGDQQQDMSFGRWGAIASKLQCQPSVAFSTIEAEYRATSDAIRHAIWIQHILRNMPINSCKTMTINNTTHSADSVPLTKNPVHQVRAMHVAVRHHFIQEEVDLGSLIITQVPARKTYAVFLIKPLPREPFERLRLQIGLSVLTRQVGVLR